MFDFYRKRRINEYTNDTIMEVSSHTLRSVKENNTVLDLWLINKSDFVKEFRSVANISLPFCILGLIGNGILFSLLCCTIKKKTRFTIYIANLATGDFIMLLHYFVTYLFIFLPSYASFYSQHVMVISLLFESDPNIYFLTAISAERYIMVSFPSWSQSHQQMHYTAILCVSLWILSFLLTLIGYFFCLPRYLEPHIIGFLHCHTTIVLQYSINYLVFIPVMVFSTLALLNKMQKATPQNFPAGLDISIVATVFLHLTLSAGIKVVLFMKYLVVLMPNKQHRRVSLILNCIDNTVNPFVYLLVGCWKRKKGLEPLHVLIEGGLNDQTAARPECV